MKGLRKFGVVMAAALILAGCGGEGSPQAGDTDAIAPQQEQAAENEVAVAPEEKGQAIPLAEGQLQISVPDGWLLNEDENPFDVQYIAPRQDMNTGVFVYKLEELDDSMTAQEVLNFHVEDLQSKRDNFTPIYLQKTETHQGKTITASAFSGEKDGQEDYYKFTLLEFSDNPNVLLILLQVSLPEVWGTSDPIFINIARSAKTLQLAQ
ncbi:MAG: hypothetical protein AAGA67_10005 [Cyanobacteria bacterium P01_F01_bin.153]